MPRSRATLLDYVAPDYDFQGDSCRQCSHLHNNGARCRSVSGYDYRFCDRHLLQHYHVVIQPSRIPGAGLGLFAARCFRRGDLIGRFAGELIDNQEYERRYTQSSGFAPYVLGVDNNTSHDESVARTAFSYANDGVDLKDPWLRRNYIYRTGTHVVWHKPEWPHVINCVCDADRSGEDKQRACLYALGDIERGDELLYSYAGVNGPSKDENGEWIRDSQGQICDGYFYGRSIQSVT